MYGCPLSQTQNAASSVVFAYVDTLFAICLMREYLHLFESDCVCVCVLGVRGWVVFVVGGSLLQ